MGRSVAEKYKVLDEVQHVLQRPGMYLGQVAPVAVTSWVVRDGSFRKEEVTYSPALLKVFDEIVSNSVDESVRNPKLNEIRVTVSRGIVTVLDNGGIPVVKHPEHGVMVPELVFSNLRAGSNFDDSEDRRVAGTHGLGSTLTNIFSTRFSVSTGDGKKEFHQTFTANMSQRTKPSVKASKRKFTQISFEPDLTRFGVATLDASPEDPHFLVIQKRVLDLAACNPRVKFFLQGERVLPKASFRDYAEMYCGKAVHESFPGWEVTVGPSSEGFQQVSFVNSACTSEGGSHVNPIVSQVTDYLVEAVRKKHKVDVKPSEVRSHLFFVVSASVRNPSFSTQTKERLISPASLVLCPRLSDRSLKAVLETGVVDSILDWARRKSEADERAELRKLAKEMSGSRVERLIDAKGSNRGACSLGIFEGMSALSAVRRYRDPQTFGAFPLKGKFINVSEMRPAEVMRNAEAADLVASLGLRPGESPGASMRYGRVLVYTDADTDGSSIFCLMLNFLARFWPELFDRGMVYRVLTPLAVAKKPGEVRNLYTMDELSAWKGGRSWELEYKKGLSSLEDEEYRQIIQSPVLVRIDRDALYRDSLERWFGPDSTPRKEKLMRA